MNSQTGIESILLTDDGTFSNNPHLPLLLYTGVFLPFRDDPAANVESRFNSGGWPAAWRNGVYASHHYHSEAHEALGVYRGSATVQFGGPDGPLIRIRAGDAVILPAGTAHRLIEATPDFAVVGAYPSGQRPDMCYGRPGERPDADTRVGQVPLPTTDPILGMDQGVVVLWKRDADCRMRSNA